MLDRHILQSLGVELLVVISVGFLNASFLRPQASDPRKSLETLVFGQFWGTCWGRFSVPFDGRFRAKNVASKKIAFLSFFFRRNALYIYIHIYIWRYGHNYRQRGFACDLFSVDVFPTHVRFQGHGMPWISLLQLLQKEF